MRIFVHYLAALAAAAASPVAASPRPQEFGSAPLAAPTFATPLSTSLNIPITAVVPSAAVPTTGLVVVDHENGTSSTSRRRMSHWEPVPIFSKSCDCPKLATVAYPCWATDALQKCNFEELHSFVCWTSANFGCPSPTRSCDNLFEPTPVTGKHPCDLGGNIATVTDAPFALP